ncbi:hypothetical protein [Vibrio anguillarum]|uniref:hypothetical protein n=1 Tax=Vibrio anguillarum TaxID=55601 RepID=UPI00131D61AE|nr:hypothetical protein [Vibrio anguillarum]MBT2912745.1 hypothetical protein [Vibrio anguillarum]MBT2932895.1 hypothetical protein [Vibrio anguillarum]MBT2938516.1 hypothetical protein [Vibrio anguillarum]MBT2945630.1 hypothetical protein [Vibrio anguillarum]MBT2952836.1 hypothetical protein [Vibrio anguillarum]
MKQVLSSQLEKVTGGYRNNTGSGGRAKSFNDRNNTGTKSGSGGCTGGRRN